MIYLYVNLIEGEKMPAEPKDVCRQCEGKGWITGIERPCSCNPGGAWRSSKTTFQRYHENLESAKASSVPVDDQDTAWRLIRPDINLAKNFKMNDRNSLSYRIGNHHFETSWLADAFYGPFDIGYEIKDHGCCGHPCEDYNDVCMEHGCKWEHRKIAILLPEKEPVNPSKSMIKKIEEYQAQFDESDPEYRTIEGLISFIHGSNEPVGKLEEKEESPVSFDDAFNDYIKSSFTCKYPEGYAEEFREYLKQYFKPLTRKE